MNDKVIEYRVLSLNDWQQWKAHRLEGLIANSISFDSSHEDECDLEDAFFQSNITDNSIFGAFIDGKLVSTVGMSWNKLVKLRHRSGIFGVYTTESARGKGIARKLIEISLEEAKKRKVLWVQLTVWSDNTAAVQLYTKLGFRKIGTEFRSLLINNEYFIDQDIMAVNLDAV